MKRYDQRSEEAQAYRTLYKSARWRKLRALHLAAHPLCERCKAKKRLTVATIVHHRIAHKGNLTLFWDNVNLEAICAPHHDADAQSEERIGYSKEIGLDGWPTSDRHPVNTGFVIPTR